MSVKVFEVKVQFVSVGFLYIMGICIELSCGIIKQKIKNKNRLASFHSAQPANSRELSTFIPSKLFF